MERKKNQQSSLSSEGKKMYVPPKLSLKKEDIELTKTLTVHLENKVKELHNNIRHITQLAMTWFAFFVTTNYVTLGWFAKVPSSTEGEKVNPLMIYIVAGVFIIQNCLGILGIELVRKTSKAKTLQASIYENWLLSTYKKHIDPKINAQHITALECPGIPIILYDRILIFLEIVVVSLVFAWAFILILPYIN